MENATAVGDHRVVAYFDVDCFYAQAEELKRPHLQGRPVGVTQKYLVVTCNYEARQRGVPKMASIQAAKDRCPDLILFNGEDLTPYRAASKSIMAVLGRFGVLERRGLDEFALDITAEVMKRSTLMLDQQEFSGHVLGLIDLSENRSNFDPKNIDHYLMLGSKVVSEIRVAVERETGFRCSCGIAMNKMLAKLVSSVNKPNQQTCILCSAVNEFLSPLSVRKLPGIGHQTESLLKDMGIMTVADLRSCTLQQLSVKFGKRLGATLFDNCRGIDNSLVQDKGPPKSLSVEDSFQPCTSYKQAEEILRSLAPDLIARLDEDKDEYSRMPKMFTIKWRYPGNWAFRSSSANMPLEIISPNIPKDKRLETVVEIAVKLLLQSLGRQSFSIVVLNIGATNFTASLSGSICGSHDIRLLLNNPSQSPQKTLLKIVSKREARINREETERGGLSAKLKQSILQQMDEDAGTLHEDTHISDDDCPEVLDEDECSWKPESSWSPQKVSYQVRRGLLTGSETSGEDTSARGASELAFWKSSVLDNITEDAPAKRPAEERNDERATPAAVCKTDANNSTVNETSVCMVQFESFICTLCGQEVQGDPQSRQEHDDYEYALKLNSQEQRFATFVTMQPTRTKQLSVKTAPHKSHKRAKTQNNRKTRQSGTLDCFVFRS